MLKRLVRSGPLQEIWLTPEERQYIDPTGDGARRLSRMVETSCTPMPDYLRGLSRREWLALYLSSRDSRVLPEEYLEFDRAHESKYGPQGGYFPLVEAQQQLKEFYSNAAQGRSFKAVIDGRDYLLARIRERVSRVGLPQIGYELGTTGTCAGLPTMLDKGTFTAETLLMHENRHVFPDLLGQRNQRLKHRVVHNDANLNVRKIEGILRAVRKWLIREFPEYFASWINPTLSTHPRLTDAALKNRYSVETDFDACDAHFSWELTCAVVLPIYESLLPPIEFIKFADFVCELFQQPVYFGDYCWTGLHNLFSGEAITNDFETEYDVCLELGSCMHARVSPDEVDCHSEGDDVAVITRNGEQARRIFDAIVEEAGNNGMPINLQKSRIGHGVIHFLRRLYAPGVGRLYYNIEGRPFLYGAYPGILTMNSIVNPEWRTSSKPTEAIRALLQRLDNLQGNPDANAIIGLIVSRVNIEHRLSRIEDTERAYYYDWWQRLYDEQWTVENSYSWKVIRNLKLERKLID